MTRKHYLPGSSLILSILVHLGTIQPAYCLELAFGDFDLNGFDDLVMGCPLQTVIHEAGDLSEAGAVSVIYADTDGLGLKSQLWHLNKEGIPGEATAFDNLGDALAVGDFNVDGVDDLAVGIPKADEEGIKNVGAVTIIFGAPVVGLDENAATTAKLLSRRTFGDHPRKSDRFGSALAVGNFNGDKDPISGLPIDDLVIGVPGVGPGGRGMAYVLYGPITDLSAPVYQTWSQGGGAGAFEVKGNAEEDDRFSATLATGDFDGDGFEDLVVGSTVDPGHR